MRPPATSHGELEAVAFELFRTEGYDATSVEDIAAAAGISRRTLFRYFPSKTDLVWGDFDGQLDRLRVWFDGASPKLRLMTAVRQGVVYFNHYPPETYTSHRERLALILDTPSLLANSTLRFEQWRGVIADFAGGRLGLPPESHLPRTIGHAALGTAMAAYEIWLATPDLVLRDLLDDGFRGLAKGFA